jgi:hypothetical protein
MLFHFPYDLALRADLLWNPDTKNGWNGPYIHNQDINDPWGTPYIIVDPELDYRLAYRCDLTVNPYQCVTPNDPAWNAAIHNASASTARLVSFGPDGIYAGDNPIDPCQPNNDDLVLCLVQ